MREYIVQKLGIDTKQHLVGWDSLLWHQHHHFLKRQATRQKHIFRWAPTNARKVETNQSNNPSCPRCRHPSETTLHILDCNLEGAQKHQSQALNKLEDILTTLKTHPDMITMILGVVRCLADLDFQGSTGQVRQVIDEQQPIR